MTYLSIDDDLIAEAMRVGGHRTPEAAVTAALDAYVLRRRRPKILELFGTTDVDPDYDDKAERQRMNAAVQAEDAEDLEAFEQRAGEPEVDFESFVSSLKRGGKV